MAAAVDRLAAQGVERLALSRYFLGPGHLPDKALAQASGRGPEVLTTEVLGASRDLAGLLLERYDEARTGEVRMNCDACLYRTPYPGRESALGLPQVPHTHPDDR